MANLVQELIPCHILNLKTGLTHFLRSHNILNPKQAMALKKEVHNTTIQVTNTQNILTEVKSNQGLVPCWLIGLRLVAWTKPECPPGCTRIVVSQILLSFRFIRRLSCRLVHHERCGHFVLVEHKEAHKRWKAFPIRGPEVLRGLLTHE